MVMETVFVSCDPDLGSFLASATRAMDNGPSKRHRHAFLKIAFGGLNGNSAGTRPIEPSPDDTDLPVDRSNHSLVVELE
jgi:hypothetical protein